MDPDGQRFRQDYLAGRALLADSNVLIPLIPISGTFRPEMQVLFDTIQANGMPLFTTEGFIEELFRHGTWASHLVESHGADSLEVLEAARGDGYKQNTFLDGFVRYTVEERTLSFQSYLEECIGGKRFTRKNLREFLENSLNLPCLDFKVLGDLREEAFIDRDDTKEFIRREAEDRLIDKSDSRIEAEAEAYTLIANAGVLGDKLTPSAKEAAKDLAVLSQGGFLNRIARYGPQPLNKYIVVPPEALYAFLLRSGVVAEHSLSFRELMVSSLFDTSLHFIDREKYKDFFGGLINEAERIFSRTLRPFKTK
jgi:hypothetical protein